MLGVSTAIIVAVETVLLAIGTEFITNGFNSAHIDP
jgi:hypothetical protein